MSTNANERGTHPPNLHAPIIPSDVTVHNPPFRAIYAGGAGTLVIEDTNGTQATYAVPAGFLLVMVGRRLMAASSATLLVAQY